MLRVYYFEVIAQTDLENQQKKTQLLDYLKVLRLLNLELLNL